MCQFTYTMHKLSQQDKRWWEKESGDENDRCIKGLCPFPLRGAQSKDWIEPVVMVIVCLLLYTSCQVVMYSVFVRSNAKAKIVI